MCRALSYTLQIVSEVNQGMAEWRAGNSQVPGRPVQLCLKLHLPPTFWWRLNAFDLSFCHLRSGVLHLHAFLSFPHIICSQLWALNPNIPVEARTDHVPRGHQQRGRWGPRDCEVKPNVPNSSQSNHCVISICPRQEAGKLETWVPVPIHLPLVV